MTEVTAPVPGHVEPGGSALSWRAGALTVHKVSVSAQDNNSYLLTHTSGEQLLIDAADSAETVLAILASAHPQAHLSAVLTTHGHWDHHRALAPVIGVTGATALASAADASHLPVVVGRTIDHGDVLTLGDVALEVIGLRGHTPGSLALAYTPATGPSWLFTGDSLFPGGVGKTRSPAEFAALLADVSARVFDRFDDHTIVHPGHGDSTTLGAERPFVAEWRSRGW
ncbi:MBL fold metallo-hydrolase [Ruania halotolerans]|uniref:MBL fold metallo-hydrolase n=1 Tax=Ruania halotolerans TaxID=2897773 RepID=UPI001E2D8CE1|nr:MBL fold metallo-hydrolase [Ruania halotolerans]UFU08127.1 MBL fold metallo-hydrolase [Ruania halotolerans]